MSVTTVSQERNYAQVPRGVLYHPGLSGNDVRVYATLSDRAGRKDMAWPSVRKVAEDLSMSTSTVRQSLDRLEALALIEVERSRGSVNRYHLPLKGVADSATPRSDFWEGGVADSATEQDTRTRHKNKTPPTSPPRESMLPAERWARRWCEMRNVPETRSVLKAWIPAVQDFIAGGGQPSEELLQTALRAGIEHPGGWGFVAGEVATAEERRRISEWMAQR